jgi:hypothetical protein
MWGTRGLEEAEFVGVGVAEEGETDDVGVGGEEVVELVVGEEGGGWSAGADVLLEIVDGVDIDAGWDVGEDPGLLVEGSHGLELRG